MVSQRAFTSLPIFVRSHVNRTSGRTAKDSWRLRMTWLRMTIWPASVSVKVEFCRDVSRARAKTVLAFLDEAAADDRQ